MKLSKIFLYLFLGALLLLVVAEVLVRLLFPQPLDPGRTFVVENEIPGLKQKVRFKIDANQIRGFDSKKDKAKAAVRILCIGGNSTSTMLQGVEDTWWGRLGAQLEKSLGKPVEIGCITAPGCTEIVGGAQWLDHLLGEVAGVDLVVAMYGHGAVLYAGANFSFDPKAIKPIRFEEKGGLMFTLAKSSHLVRLARNAHIRSKRDEQQRQLGKMNHLRDRFTAASQAYRSLTKTSVAPPWTNDPIVKFLHGVGVITEVAREHGVKLVVVGEPTVFSALPSPDVAGTLHTPVHVGPGETDFARPASGWVESELGRFYVAASKVCAGRGVPFANMQGVILPSSTNFYSEAGLTDAGAADLATQLLPLVEKSFK